MTSPKARKGRIYDLIAPPLILVTPFISFANYNNYSYAAPELWLCLAGLVALGLLCGAIMALGGTWLRILGTAALLTLYVDFQSEWFDDQPGLWVPAFALGALLLCWVLRENLSRITVPGFVMMLVAALVVPDSPGELSFRRVDPEAAAQGTANPLPPVVVHLILDEFIGIEGIPLDVPNGPEVRSLLRSFLQDNGFYTFGRAYSRFDYTMDAIPSILNHASIADEGHFATESRPHHLLQNRYFKVMYENGYRINVYQTDFMDFCTGYETIIASCHTYVTTGITYLQSMQLSPVAKAWLALDTFSRLAVIERALGYVYNSLRRLAQRYGHQMPRWMLSRFNLTAVRGAHVLDVLAADVAKARAGEMFFAHVLFPHQPYTYGRSCNVRDPADWDVASDRAPLPWNTVESRARRYALYLEQALCTRAKLEAMFDAWRRTGLYDRMKIIIHGDHGSRVSMDVPKVPGEGDLVASDYVDSFSTLFALKAPGLRPAYDRRMVAVQDLLMPIAHGQPLDRLPFPSGEPYVLLATGDSVILQPMPEFGEPEPGPERIYLSRP